MHLQTVRVQNFRRLRDVKIDLASDISIFVGANNSGKTSAAHAVQMFLSGSKDRFSIHDFNAACWEAMDVFGESGETSTLPTISLDMWFHVESHDLHRVIDLLPSLDWEGNLVGVRIEYVATDAPLLLANFVEAREQARQNVRPGVNGGTEYHPSPRTLCKFLSDNQDKQLHAHYELRYYILDRQQFSDDLVALPEYAPSLMGQGKGRSGRETLNTLLKVDFLPAQKHLSDTSSGSRAEDLSNRLSRFYKRNLEKHAEDHDAIRALAESEAMLNEHLSRVFEPTLSRLGELGYPGMTDPRLLIKSALNPVTIMSSNDGTRVHYALGEPEVGCEPATLPDRYNGLGFKNLIYIVIELLDLHAQWIDTEEERPPLHLIYIEEPEAHLHAQIQQVFIRKVLDILAIEGPDSDHYSSQLVITTHSPHILYERGFRPIRYFRRSSSGLHQASEVLNLSAYYQRETNPTRDFLERYLKLTHCDLFFADAAVLVEGNVERLLLPQMIANIAPRLQSAYLSVLEIGGAFGYRFRSLIEFLGITALVITDIDSVTNPEQGEVDRGDDEETPTGTACMVEIEHALTSNQTLIQWLPTRRTIAELLTATPEQRTQPRLRDGDSLVRVAYQSPVDVTWNGTTLTLTGRTLEEAFAYENLVWCQHADRADLRLRIPRAETLSIAGLAERLHKRIKGTAFNKTDFALGLLAQDPVWITPKYIADGLMWLATEAVPELPPVVEQGERSGVVE